MALKDSQKGNPVTFYPLELYRIAVGLPDRLRLLVFDIFIISNVHGKMSPLALKIFDGIDGIDRLLATLIEMKILSADEDGCLFLQLSTK